MLAAETFRSALAQIMHVVLCFLLWDVGFEVLLKELCLPQTVRWTQGDLCAACRHVLRVKVLLPAKQLGPAARRQCMRVHARHNAVTPFLIAHLCVCNKNPELRRQPGLPWAMASDRYQQPGCAVF